MIEVWKDHLFFVAMNALVSSPALLWLLRNWGLRFDCRREHNAASLNEWEDLQRDYTLEFQLTWLMDPKKHVLDKELPFKYAAY